MLSHIIHHDNFDSVLTSKTTTQVSCANLRVVRKITFKPDGTPLATFDLERRAGTIVLGQKKARTRSREWQRRGKHVQMHTKHLGHFLGLAENKRSVREQQVTSDPEFRTRNAR